MPCGTTGEFPLLSIAERQRVIEIVVDIVAGRVPVIAHAGAPSTLETICLAQHAASQGSQAVSVVAPYFYGLPDRALVDHFCRVADAIPSTPVFLYNIPQNAGNALSRAVVERIIARCPNVVGIKDSTGDLDTLISFVGLEGGRFQVVCGSDGLLLRALGAGACAAVSGNANVFPEVLVELVNSVSSGDMEVARRQQALLDAIRTALLDGRSISLIKRALELRGPTAGPVRAPLPEATAQMVVDAQQRLQEHQLLL
jgi:4-hydroxy-tetrahydrodipicolinate synthase